MNARSILVTIALAAAGSAGCTGTATVEAGPVVVEEATGLLTLSWSVAGAQSASQCAYYGADAVEMIVWDDAGFLAADEVAYCEEFELTLALAPGFYQAEVTLIDAADVAVSTTLPLEDLVVTDGSELVVAIDFPPDSMIF